MWSKSTELLFFNESLKKVSKEQLFYITEDNQYLSYWPNNYTGKKTTLQSRNSLIGNFSEKWATKLISNTIEDDSLHVLQNVQCEQISLNYRSPADIVVSTKNKTKLKPKHIRMIFEVKMSLVWNWKLDIKTNRISEIGDYKTHQGSPGLLRSDSLLKAIGKCINIRISDYSSSKIPIVILTNTPITETSSIKADNLKTSGIIQGIWSINSNPLNNEETIKTTQKGGFKRFDNQSELKRDINILLNKNYNFFSSMKSEFELGKIIELANSKESYDEKGTEFLKMIKV
ncbi:MAG: hypothetical protein BZ138_07555 [Methanosphaera sp. rholeuAM270]|nr:MAG: hypothetical protein BZ138_07555 [Methanosphaera sp. rholeuAM270]